MRFPFLLSTGGSAREKTKATASKKKTRNEGNCVYGGVCVCVREGVYVCVYGGGRNRRARWTHIILEV